MLFENDSRLHGISVPFIDTWYGPFIMAVGKEILQKPAKPCSPVALNERNMMSRCSINIGAAKPEIEELEITST